MPANQSNSYFDGEIGTDDLRVIESESIAPRESAISQHDGTKNRSSLRSDIIQFSLTDEVEQEVGRVVETPYPKKLNRVHVLVEGNAFEFERGSSRIDSGP